MSKCLNSYAENIAGLILHSGAYSQRQTKPELVCECDVGLFPCSLSLAGGLHLESQQCSLDRTTLWEDNHTLPRTIS